MILAYAVTEGAGLDDIQCLQVYLYRLQSLSSRVLCRQYQAFRPSVVSALIYAMVHDLTFLIKLGDTFQRADDYILLLDSQSEELFHPLVEDGYIIH